MPPSPIAELTRLFPRTVAINLPERTDRRRGLERELARAGVPAGRVQFFPAVRVDTLEGFPDLGTRGCFLSHLAVLRQALADGLSGVLVLEDDARFAPDLRPGETAPALAAGLAGAWDLAYFGNPLALPPDGGVLQRVDGAVPVMLAHFYAVSGRCLPALVDNLEAVQTRPPGHPLGAKLPVDGAYTLFRAARPEVVTLAAAPSLGDQRSSRSDITRRWYDQTPVTRTLLAAARVARNRVREWSAGRAGGGA